MMNYKERRIREARRIARMHYEQGNQMRSYKQVWERYAGPKLGICYRTFLNYLRCED